MHVRFSTAETQFKGDTLTRQKYKKYWRQAKVDLDFDFDLAWTCDWDWDKKKSGSLEAILLANWRRKGDFCGRLLSLR